MNIIIIYLFCLSSIDLTKLSLAEEGKEPADANVRIEKSTGGGEEGKRAARGRGMWRRLLLSVLLFITHYYYTTLQEKHSGVKTLISDRYQKRAIDRNKT